MIYDTDGNQILSASFDLRSEAVKQLIISIDCIAGEFLRSSPTTRVTTEARESGVGGWTDLQTNQLDLAPYDGTAQDFDIRITADTVYAYERQQVRLTVGRPLRPETPYGLYVIVIYNNQIDFGWVEADDPTTVAGYETRINVPTMAIVDQVSDIGYGLNTGVIGIDPSTEVFIEIRAYNAAGDYSGWSNQFSATTLP